MAQSPIIDRCVLCDSKERVDYFCTNCQEILCLNCKVTHSKSKKTKQDKIISLSQARHDGLVHQSTTVFCDEHSSVEITLFCLQCDQVVCVQCMSRKHKGHGVTTVDEIQESKSEELKGIIKALKEKKVVYENAFDIQGEAHSRFLKSVDKVEEEILEQKTKIIEELNLVCNKQFAELRKLRQNENKIYSDACNQIQAQNKAVTSSIQTAENSLANNNTALIVKSTVAAKKTLQGIEEPSMPPTTVATYQPGDRSEPAINSIQGKVNIKHTTPAYQQSYTTISQVQSKADTELGAKPKVMADVHKVKLSEQKTSRDNKQQSHKDNKPRIDRSRVRVKSTVGVKYASYIHIIVPLQNKTAWVLADRDHYLTLINSKGEIIAESVSLYNDIYDSFICDAKLYRNGLLVTCYDQCEIYNLSLDGEYASTFCDMSPYNTRGLCVTQDEDVMVCLGSSDNKDNKVVRLNKAGVILQTIQHDVTGAPLYNDPYLVTVLTTGEVIVKDKDKLVSVDREAKHSFTWERDIEGRKLAEYYAFRITNDSKNNLFFAAGIDGVVVLGKDSSEGMCLVGSPPEIEVFNPTGVAVDNVGQLWVGGQSGAVHIIEY